MSYGSDADLYSGDEPLPAIGAEEDAATHRSGLRAAAGQYPTTNGYELFYNWFVRYNPLYFFSALCVLGGVYFLTLELDGGTAAGASGDWSVGQIHLFAVIQLYELLLLAAAGFLVHKAGLIRPAVILMMLEGLFYFDCTFRLETLSHLGVIGTVLTVIWVILAPVKVWLLGLALRVRIPRTVFWLLTCASLGLALMLQSLAMPDVNRAMIILVATWWGAALVALAVILKPSISRSDAPGDAADEVSKRIVKSLLMLLGGTYFYHVLNYYAWVGVDAELVLGPMIGTAFLMLALFRDNEREVWTGTGLFLLASLVYPPAAIPMCVLATLALLYRAWQSGNTRFLVGAVLTGYVATWAFAWTGNQPPPPPMWSTLAACGLLAYLAWKLREPTAVLVLAVAALGVAGRYDFNLTYLLPDTRLGAGMLLVAGGFLALTAGVWVNWCFRSPTRAPDPGRDTDASPGSRIQSGH